MANTGQIDISQILPQLAAMLQQKSVTNSDNMSQFMLPTGTPMPTAGQGRFGGQNQPADAAKGVATPVNQAATQDPNSQIMALINFLQNQGKAEQLRQQRQLGIGPAEEGHPIRAFRHLLENIGGVGFELHGRRAPWLEQREAVNSPNFPNEYAASMAGLMRPVMAEMQLPAVLAKLSAQTQAIPADTKIREEGVQERQRHDVTTEQQAEENAAEKIMLAQQNEAFQRDMLQAKDIFALQKKKGDWDSKIDSTMLSDEDKALAKQEMQAFYEKVAQGLSAPTPGATNQDSRERSTSGNDPLGIR